MKCSWLVLLMTAFLGGTAFAQSIAERCEPVLKREETHEKFRLDSKEQACPSCTVGAPLPGLKKSREDATKAILQLLIKTPPPSEIILTPAQEKRLVAAARELGPKTKDAGTRAFIDLVLKYPNKTRRLASSQAYFDDLLSALKLFPTGANLVGCYDKLRHPYLSRSEVLFMQNLPAEMKELLGPEAIMSLHLSKDGDTGKYVRQLIFNAEADPFTTMDMLSHELKHGCNASGIDRRAAAEASERKFRELTDRTELLAGSDSFLEKARSWITTPAVHALAWDTNRRIAELQREFIVDEVRAYQAGNDLFRELVTRLPDLACLAAIQGRESLLQARFEDGTAPALLASGYLKTGRYDPEVVLNSQALKAVMVGAQKSYDLNRIPTTGPVLHEDIINQLRKEGYRATR